MGSPRPSYAMNQKDRETEAARAEGRLHEDRWRAEARRRNQGVHIGLVILIVTVAALTFLDSSALGLVAVCVFLLILLCSYGYRAVFSSGDRKDSPRRPPI